MRSSNYIDVSSTENKVVIHFRRKILEQSDSPDLAELYPTEQIKLEFNPATITYDELADLVGVLDALYKLQQQKAVAMEQNIQNARNKATQLELLSQQMCRLFDSLAPMQRIYHKSDPTVFLDLPRDIALDQVNADESMWSFDSERVSTLTSVTV